MHRPLLPAPTSLLLADSPGYSQQQVGVAMTTNDLGYSLPLLPSVLPLSLENILLWCKWISNPCLSLSIWAVMLGTEVY